jgi:hypothetical protein
VQLNIDGTVPVTSATAMDPMQLWCQAADNLPRLFALVVCPAPAGANEYLLSRHLAEYVFIDG